MEDRTNNVNASRRCVDCLIVKKVYDACSKRECLERQPFCVALPQGNIDDYTYLHTEFGKAVIEPYEAQPYLMCKDDCHARLRMTVGVPVWVVLRRRGDRCVLRLPACPICNGVTQMDNIVRFPVDMTVYAPKEFLRQGRFEPYAESYVECGCATTSSDGSSLLLTLGFFFIVKVVSDVQLKVPNFGFCETPPECREEECEVNFCQTFLDENATPFPKFFPSDLDCC